MCKRRHCHRTWHFSAYLHRLDAVTSAAKVASWILWWCVCPSKSWNLCTCFSNPGRDVRVLPQVFGCPRSYVIGLLCEGKKSIISYSIYVALSGVLSGWCWHSWGNVGWYKLLHFLWFPFSSNMHDQPEAHHCSMNDPACSHHHVSPVPNTGRVLVPNPRKELS